MESLLFQLICISSKPSHLSSNYSIQLVLEQCSILMSFVLSRNLISEALQGELLSIIQPFQNVLSKRKPRVISMETSTSAKLTHADQHAQATLTSPVCV